jgi:hypothetical protein
MGVIVIAKEYVSVMSDGTRVILWKDAELWRARVEQPGDHFVRVDTVEQLLTRIPERHVHRSAACTSDVVVFRSCEKSAWFLGEWERWREGFPV